MRRFVFVIILIITASVVALSLMASYQTEDQEITLVAKGMTFYLKGSGTPNPVISLRAGQQVRIVFENQDSGIIHELQIDGLPVALRALRPGSKARTRLFQVPDSPGRYRYYCLPHEAMMNGVLAVLPRD